MIDDVYFERCNELYHLILKAYIDKNLIKTIEVKRSKMEKNFYVVGHVCELLKADLALTIWKIYLDNDKKANTIKNLNSYICTTYSKTKASTKLPKHYNESLKNLCEARSQFIAHNDISKCDTKITMNELYKILDEIRKIYNALCNESIDDRVIPILDCDIYALELKTILSALV